MLWLEIANRRMNAPNVLAEAVGELDMERWPAPIVRLYLGELTAAQTLAAAKGTADLACEVSFYAGELALAKSKKDEAVRLFQAAATGCPSSLRGGWAPTEKSLVRYHPTRFGALKSAPAPPSPSRTVKGRVNAHAGRRRGSGQCFT